MQQFLDIDEHSSVADIDTALRMSRRLVDAERGPIWHAVVDRLLDLRVNAETRETAEG